jgi:hypothetical protein
MGMLPSTLQFPFVAEEIAGKPRTVDVGVIVEGVADGSDVVPRRCGESGNAVTVS